MDGEEPVLRVIPGDPTAEELAALVGVVGVVIARAGSAPPPPRFSYWQRNARPGATDLPPRPGPHGWRTSALPRHHRPAG